MEATPLSALRPTIPAIGSSIVTSSSMQRSAWLWSSRWAITIKCSRCHVTFPPVGIMFLVREKMWQRRKCPAARQVPLPQHQAQVAHAELHWTWPYP